MRAMARRVAALSAKRAAEDDEPFFLRLLRVISPDRPEPQQERWLALAEAAVDAEMRRERRRMVFLCSHAVVGQDRLVEVSGAGERFLVAIEGEGESERAVIRERTETLRR